MDTNTDNGFAFAGYLIWHLSLRWRGAVDRALAPLGLTHAQYALMASLYGLSQTGARPSQRELAEFSGLDPMYVSRLARQAEQAGQLRRVINAADSRAVQLTLTDSGRATIRAAIALVGGLHEQLLAPLGQRGDPRRAALRETLLTLLRQAKTLDSAPADPPNTPTSTQEV